MEALDIQRPLEAVERLQARLAGRGEAAAAEKLRLLRSVLASPLFLHILTTLPILPPANQMSKSASLSSELARDLASAVRTLTHSESFTWGQRSLSPVEPAHASDRCSHSSMAAALASPTEPRPPHFPGHVILHSMSEFCTPPRMSRHLSMGRDLSAISSVEKRHVELIELENVGKGLGFGIVGGRHTGVMVKTILPSGAAGRDRRLRSGDQILRIGDEDLAGLSCEAVAQVLRNAGSRVRLLIGRDVATGDEEPSSPTPSTPGEMERVDTQVRGEEQDYEFDVQFTKNTLGLGFTTTSFLGDLKSGVLVKSIVKGSAVDQDGRLHIGDRILAVDGVSMQGCSEPTALEVLRRTGPAVRLRLARTPFRLDDLPPPPPSLRHGDPRHRRPRPALETGGAMRSLCDIAKRAAYAYVQDYRQEIRDAVKLSESEEEALRKRWQQALGPRYEVVVCQLERFSETSGLGVSVEMTTGGRHYLRSVLPEGPVGQSRKIFNGDQILELNGIPLVGESHAEVTSLLRELPLRVCVVACRPLPAPPPRPSPPLDHQPSLKQLLAEFTHKLERSGCTIPAPAEAHGKCSVTPAEAHGKCSVRPASPPLAMWEKDVQVVELQKGEEGLGFSILDYQDPEDAAKTVLVIRSLVADGVADRDGSLLPGDRLMSVNSTRLEAASLEVAVQVLKSTPLGAVRIGVAKPLPLEAYEAAAVRESGGESGEAAGEHDALAAVTTGDARGSERNDQQRSAVKEDKLRHRHGNMETGDKPQAPPPPRSSLEKTITVVRGNRSLGMLSALFMVLLCAYFVGTAILGTETPDEF